MTTKHKYNTSPEIVLAQNTYNELGRLQTSTSASQDKLKTTYSYNIRSWSRTIDNELYKQTLDYELNGNIKTQNWAQAGKNRTYTFEYDELSQIRKANYSQSPADDSRYSTTYTYDKHGNMLTLNREGLVTASGKCDFIDKLALKYTGNQLKTIKDDATDVLLSSSTDFKYDPKMQNVEYKFNDNGAMTYDPHKGTTISYNSLNLPQIIEVNNSNAQGKNLYTYNASGTKLRVIYQENKTRQIAPVEGSTLNSRALTEAKTLDYVGNKIYENGVLKQILVDNGYIENGKYYFYIKDHLGNNRIVADASGTVIQSNQYYPFGMMFAESTGQEKQDFKYNGKELDRMHGLNLYDYSARYLDNAYGRFTSVDPLAEEFYSWSPYSYVYNNPLKHTDPDGKAPMALGALIGAVVDYGFQVGINYMEGKRGAEAWTNVDMGSIAISAAAGATGVGLGNVVSKGITATKVIKNSSKAVKVAAIVAGDVAIGATVSTGTQLAKTGKVDAKSVIIDAATSGLAGQIGSKVKGLKQNSSQGKQLQQAANRANRIAKTSSRSSRVSKAAKATEKAGNYGNGAAATSGTAASNTASNTYKEYEDRKKNN